MSWFAIATTVAGLTIAGATLLFNILTKRREQQRISQLDPDSSHVKVHLENDNAAENVILCLPKRAKKTVFLAPLNILVQNKNSQAVTDVFLNVTMPEFLFRHWNDVAPSQAASIFNIKQHNRLLEGTGLVRSTMSVPVINPGAAIAMEFTVFLETPSHLELSTPIDAGGQKYELDWKVIFFYSLKVQVSSSAGTAEPRNFNIYVFMFDEASEMPLDKQITSSEMFKNILERWRSGGDQIETPGKQPLAPIAAFIRFATTDVIESRKKTDFVFEKLAKPKLKTLRPKI